MKESTHTASRDKARDEAIGLGPRRDRGALSKITRRTAVYADS